MSDLISVIVPTYNAESGIARTLTSILSQRYTNIEVVIVDDASTDRTPVLIKEFEKEDSRIRAIRLNENQGVHEARMQGLSASSGQWIGFVDADDYIDPDMYETLLHDVLTHGADIGLCGVRRVDDNGKCLQYLPRFRNNCLVNEDLLANLTRFRFGAAYVWNKLYSRDVIIDMASKSLPWRQRMNEDLLVNINCFIKAKSVYLSRSVFYSYVNNNQSATSTIGKERSFVEHYKAFALALHYYGDISEPIRELIYNLYRTQLAYGSMQVEDTCSLDPYHAELQDAIALISRSDPIALAKIASRNSLTCPSFKLRVLKQVKREIDRYFTKSNEFKFVK